jgi:hypothetical protein
MSILKNYYPNLKLQLHFNINVKLIKKEDEEKYKKLLIISIVNVNTKKSFS